MTFQTLTQILALSLGLPACIADCIVNQSDPVATETLISTQVGSYNNCIVDGNCVSSDEVSPGGDECVIRINGAGPTEVYISICLLTTKAIAVGPFPEDFDFLRISDYISEESGYNEEAVYDCSTAHIFEGSTPADVFNKVVKQNSMIAFRGHNESSKFRLCISSQPHSQQDSFCTSSPTTMPTTFSPTPSPTLNPTLRPSISPTESPSSRPTLLPTGAPSSNPTVRPTLTPSLVPTSLPSYRPSSGPTKSPTVSPTVAPTTFPTFEPSSKPTERPSTVIPSRTPTAQPSESPTMEVVPTHSPTVKSPTAESAAPTIVWQANVTNTTNTSIMSPTPRQVVSDGASTGGEDDSWQSDVLIAIGTITGVIIVMLIIVAAIRCSGTKV